MKVETAHEICGALKSKGYSVASWSVENSFHPRTVHYCINTFAPINQKRPSRKLSIEIMAALGQTIGCDLLGAGHE